MGSHNRILRFLSGLTCGYFALATLAIFILKNIYAADLLPRQVTPLFNAMYFHAATAVLAMLVWICSTRVPLRSGRAPRWFLLGVFCLFIVSLDISLGVLYPPATAEDSIYTPDFRRGWALRKSAEGICDTNSELVRTNRLGMRGPEIPLPREAHELRVLILGDSVAFGMRLKEAQSLPEKCRPAFQSALPHRQVNCFNGGVAGYATWQELDFLQEIDEGVDADIVIIQFCINDVADVLNVSGRRVTAAPLTDISTGTTHWSGFARFLNAVIVQPKLEDWRNWNLWGAPIDQRDRTDPYWNESLLYTEPLRKDIAKAWARAQDDLTQIADFCRSRNRVLICAYFPFATQLASREPIDLPGRMLQSWSEKNKVKFVDLSVVLRKVAQDRGGDAPGLMLDTVHTSEQGNELIAQELAKAVSDVLMPKR